MSVATFAADPQCVKPLVGSGYLCLDELGMHKLRRDSTRGGSPRGEHESHLISTTYIYGGNASNRWGRHTSGGQQRCSRGCGWAGIIVNHGWGLRCVPMGKRMWMDPHHRVPWSPCHNQCPNTSHLLSDLPLSWCGHARVCDADQMCDAD